MPKRDLQHKAVSATVWSGIDTLSRQGLQFGITLVLARLLTPADFGTVGMLVVFIGLAGVFIDSGFSSALIQRQDITDTDLSSVFYFNIMMSFVMGAALVLTSSWIASFYKMPVLKPLTWLLAANTVIGSFGTIQGMLLTKALNFRRQCFISLTTMTISGGVAILLAWKGYGVWSLGIQTLTATVLSVFLLWTFSDWQPHLTFSPRSIHSLFKFSSFMLLSSLLDTLFSRMNTLLIGKFYSASDLGYYSRADGLRLLPGNLLSGIISRVSFPIFAVAKTDKVLLRSGLKKAITFVMMLNVPIMLGMLVTAESLIVVLFGKQWLPCVPYIQILCLSGILFPLHVLNLNVLMAQGHSNLFFRLEVIKKVTGVVLLGAACSFGIVAIAWSAVLSGVIAFVINAHYSGKLLDYGVFRQTVDLLPCLAGSVLMAACTWFVTLLHIRPHILLLTVQVLTGVIIYVMFCHVLRLSSFVEMVKLVKTNLRTANLSGLEK